MEKLIKEVKERIKNTLDTWTDGTYAIIRDEVLTKELSVAGCPLGITQDTRESIFEKG